MSEALTGVIQAAFGRQYEVLTANGEVLLCFPRAKKSLFACGDEVTVRASGAGQGVIETLHPRRSLLYRADAFRQKLIAANVDLVVIVVACEPAFSDELVSRCLSAAESQDVACLIVLNKIDLTARLSVARATLTTYSELGYPVLELSAQQGAEPLLQRLAGRASLLVGQSGMGKSTLTNALVPSAGATTREISHALDSGKHTTTFARRYPLPGGGALIDSPGLQAFGLAHLDIASLEHSFAEFRPLLGQCRFRDCRHGDEPGCALRAAMAAGVISARRFEHYLTICNEIRYAASQRY